MQEGWLHDNYLILFSEGEINAASLRYGIAQFLSNFSVAGLRGWDDFIIRDSGGNLFTVPTVPMDEEYIEAFSLPGDVSLKSDSRFTDKLKWYVKPLVFGGDPKDRENLTWVTYEQHAQLVVWWNRHYRAVKTKT
jgi:hypothetical protein